MTKSREYHASWCGGSMATLWLCGYEIQVDEEDVGRILAKKWCVQRGENPIFYGRELVNDRMVRIRLERFVARTAAGLLTVRVPNSNALDYRKINFFESDMVGCSVRIGKRKGRKTSQYKGVALIARSTSPKWVASIRPAGASIYLGTFECEHEAALAYNKAAEKYFGPAAYQNDVATRLSSEPRHQLTDEAAADLIDRDTA